MNPAKRHLQINQKKITQEKLTLENNKLDIFELADNIENEYKFENEFDDNDEEMDFNLNSKLTKEEEK